MTYLVGKIALDINAGAPNNGRGENNVGRVKQVWISGRSYPYVSAQAFRRWLRDSMPAGEPRSPVTRSGSGRSQQAYTAGRPDVFLDDDLFGYMVAIKKENYQRDTVLATGTLLALGPQRPTLDYGTMTRGFKVGENPVLHEHEFYSADLAADVLVDLPRVGTFETDGTGLRVALSPAHAAEAVAGGAGELMFRGTSAIRLPISERRRRTALLLRTLAAVRGGAQQALHYGDRSPAFVLLAPMKGGINPFTRILAARQEESVFDTDTFAEELAAWRDELDGPISIGWAPGFLATRRDQAKTDLAELIAEGTVRFDHPRLILHTLAQEFTDGLHDDWFTDVSTHVSTDGLADVEEGAPA